MLTHGRAPHTVGMLATLTRSACRESVRPRIWQFWLCMLVLISWREIGRAQVVDPPSRPILFVHGFCGDSDGWGPLRSSLAASLKHDFPALYPDETNYDVYYDHSTNKVTFLSNNIPAESPTSVPASSRFFTIRFFDPDGGGFDSAKVAQVSILNKADEVAQVVKEIIRVTQIQDVIVIAHSMGGLVVRAYLENMASQLSCYNYNNGLNGSPVYENGLCTPGQTPYESNIATVITIDTPHGGADVAPLNDGPLDWIYSSCTVNPSTTKTELVPDSLLLKTLNYFDTSIATASSVPPEVPIHSLENYYSDHNPGWEIAASSLAPLVLVPLINTRNDAVISFDHQSMQLNLEASFKNATQFDDFALPFSEDVLAADTGCEQNGFDSVLHLIQCVGNQPSTQSLVYSLVSPIVNGNLSSITVRATVDVGNGPQPFVGPIAYHLQPSDTLQEPPEVISGTAVPYTFQPVPVGTYELVYDVGGPGGTPYITPIVTILDGKNWAPTFTLNFV